MSTNVYVLKFFYQSFTKRGQTVYSLQLVADCWLFFPTHCCVCTGASSGVERLCPIIFPSKTPQMILPANAITDKMDETMYLIRKYPFGKVNELKVLINKYIYMSW